jgi:demethylmenaquinone methyltransferase/2-methoxy-6-polyprenyl-1,4-benzoquinol methylase
VTVQDSILTKSGLDKPGLDKSTRAIRGMFEGVAPRYDLLNHLLSGRRDVAWRRLATRSLALSPGDPVLDLCCGTGDQAIELRSRGARVTAADFCVPMLAIARRKYGRLGHGTSTSAPPLPNGLAADALALPFPDAGFAAATVSFGLRNVADLDQSLRELRRVLRPGGQLRVLELAIPRGKLLRPLYLFYFTRILPRIGALVSPRGSAYSYLPSSVIDFPERGQFLDRLRAAGFEVPAFRDLTLGTVCLYSANRPGAGE